MAEVIASGVGLACFALKVVQYVLKLKQQVRGIRDAPADCLDLLEEIEMLGNFLSILNSSVPILDGKDLWLSDPFYEWTGDFWLRIENPELFMPGAWAE